MTTTPTIWKASSAINPGANSGSGPQIIGLADGDILAIWTQPSQSNGADLVGQVLDALGNPTDEGFQFQPTYFLGAESEAKAVALADGGFVVVYRSVYEAANDFLVVERFDSSGHSVAVNTITNAYLSDNYSPFRYWDLTVDTQGNYVVAFQTVTGASNLDVHAYVYHNATNQPESQHLNTVQNGSDDDFLAAIATFANGDIIAVSNERDVDNGGSFDDWQSAEFRITSEGGTSLVGHTEVAGGANIDGVAKDVAVLGNDTFVYVYQKLYDAGGATDSTLALRIGTRTSSTHVSLGGEIVIANFPHFDFTSKVPVYASVVALPDGGFFVAWTDESSGDILGSRYNSGGAVVGQAGFLITHDNQYSNYFKGRIGELSLTSDGRILLAYHNNLGEIADVVLDWRGNFIDGTDASETLTTQTTSTSLFGEGGNDHLYGLSGADLIEGGSGNDTIHGGEGDDILHGGGDNDAIFGDAGRDTLDGGAGANTLMGGDGSDTYVLNSTHLIKVGNLFVPSYDAVVEYGSEGTDLVQVSRSGSGNFNVATSYILPENVEDGQVAGAGDFSLTGNGLPNHMTGNAGVNTLDGKDGSDNLAGGAGADTLIGGIGDDVLDGGTNPEVGQPGAQGDIMVGGDGNDTYYVDSGLDLVDEDGYFPGYGHGGTDTIVSATDFYWDVASVGEIDRVSTNVVDLNNDGVTIVGGVFDNMLIGHSGTDVLFGRGGSDTYRAGDGVDFISLSTLGVTDTPNYTADGHNTVIVDPRASGPFSYDVVFEFDPAKDKIDVSHYTGAHDYTSAAQVLTHAVDDGAGNCYIVLGDGLDYLYMVGLEKADLLASDFIV